MTIVTQIETFDLELKLTGISEKTRKRYVKIVEQILYKHGALTPTIAKEEMIASLETHSEASANKVALAVKAWCKVFNLSWGKKIRKLKERPELKPQPTVEEMQQILTIPPRKGRSRGVHEMYSLMFELLCLSGMRLKEVLNLKKSDISERQIIIRQAKNREGRAIVMPPNIPFQKRLFAYLDTVKTQYLFTASKTGKDTPISWEMASREFRDRVHRLGFMNRYTAHTVRGAFINRNLDITGNLYSVQDIVGHKTAESTRAYWRGSLAKQEKVMKHDPINDNSLSPEEQFRHLQEELSNSTLLRKAGIEFHFSAHTIHIELTSKKSDNAV